VGLRSVFLDENAKNEVKSYLTKVAFPSETDN